MFCTLVLTHRITSRIYLLRYGYLVYFMTSETPIILIIIGITGDLATRKILPAVEAIAKAGVLPKHFQIVGVTRQSDITIENLLTQAKETSFVRSHLELFTMDMQSLSGYQHLAARLEEIERGFGTSAQRLFYVSVPPRASRSIIEMLGTSGLAGVPQTKLLLEKPFGTDLSSATDLVAHIQAHFTPEQVYRVDHYLAKEMTQNLIVFREYNSLFRRTWNKDFIERILIRASEDIGIEGRADFYEQTGALRDVVQSHLLQLAALMLMNPVGQDEMKKVPHRRLEALKTLHLSPREPVERGQYQGYREEVKNPESMVETYVKMTLESDNPNFIGVPITLVTGKKLGTKTTEIRIFYKKDRDMEENELVLRLQPNEGVSMSMWSKRPGYEGEIEKRVLDFTYAHHYAELPEAYEKVLVDTMRGDHDLFVSSEEVLESWCIIAPLQETWEKSDADLRLYEPGTMLVGDPSAKR